jgi:Flp pilus assembly protein TadD
VDTPAPHSATSVAPSGARKALFADLPIRDALSRENSEMLYRQGYGFLQQGKHQEAVSAFSFLHLLDPAQPRYLKALGAAHKAGGHLMQAQQAYDLALILDPVDIDAGMGSAECLIASGNLGEAKSLLECLVQLMKADSKEEDRRMRVQRVLSMLNERKMS